MIYIQECNFEDDTTPFVCSHNFTEVVRKLEDNFDLGINWFLNNYLKLNADKCYLVAVYLDLSMNIFGLR